MKKLLFLNACVNRKTSRTYRIGKALVELLCKNNGYAVTELVLENERIEALTSDTLNKRNELVNNHDYSNEMFDYANQFKNADIIVIAAPHWDCGFPAILKTYLESIGVMGIVYKYSEDGRTVGLCNAEKIYYVTTRGGYIGDENDLGYATIKQFGSYCGIADIPCISADGFDTMINNSERLIQKTIEGLSQKIINKGDKL